MADIGNNTPKLPGSGGGENPFKKEEYDILDPEAEAKNNGKKGIIETAQNAMKTAEKVGKAAKNLKFANPYVLIAIVIIIVIVGLIGFFLYMPGLIVSRLKDFAQGALDTVESWFTNVANAYINEDDLLELANYLEEMNYDLVGYGFIIPEESDIPTIEELIDDGYVLEIRGDDENARLYSQSEEEDPNGDSAYTGYYYNSSGELINNSTGLKVEGTYTDEYGLQRSTEETNTSGSAIITGFGSVDTKLLRTYLLSDYRIYSIRNNEEDILHDLYTAIKQTFGGYDSAWAKGLLKFYYAENGIATSEWSDGLLDKLGHFIFGDDISINVDSSGSTTMSIKYGHFNNPIDFSIDGWADRYGMSLEFLLSLHIATMQPDLVYAML